MKHWKLGIVAALLTGAAYAAPLPVVTSFSILGDVAKQIGGDRVAVQSLVGANQDSHAYHMTSGDIKKNPQCQIGIAQRLGLGSRRCTARSQTEQSAFCRSDQKAFRL